MKTETTTEQTSVFSLSVGTHKGYPAILVHLKQKLFITVHHLCKFIWNTWFIAQILKFVCKQNMAVGTEV